MVRINTQNKRVFKAIEQTNQCKRYKHKSHDKYNTIKHLKTRLKRFGLRT